MQQQKTTSTQKSDRDWRDLAERAAREMDPSRLTELVKQLCEKLDEADPRHQTGCPKGSVQTHPDVTRESTQHDFPKIH